MKKYLPILLSAMLITGCSSYGPKKNQTQPNDYQAPLDLDDSVQTRPPEKIDLNQLAKNINHSLPLHSLGLFEKKFDTCTAGAGFYENYNCRTRYLSVLHFTVNCRNTTGTTMSTVTAGSLKPLRHTNAKWQLGRQSGRVQLDYRGNGEVLIVSSGSIANERFILKANGHYLGQRSQYVDKIVVPKEWCKL